MDSFNLRDFLARSSDKSFDDTTLAIVLKGLPELSQSGPWLAGGALRRTLLGLEPESDFDFFFQNAEQLENFRLKLEASGLVKVRETAHHFHYRGRVGEVGPERDIQLIRFMFYTDTKSVIDSFDYTICMFAYDGDLLTVGDFSLWDLGRKRLAINRITYPVATMRRLLKYTNQGFNACKGCLSQILIKTAESPELRQSLDIQYVD